jgi:hypothetical protein
MPSTTRYWGGPLGERIAALEAERLAPVPRASHAVGVDAEDLALVLDYVLVSAGGPRVAAACRRLEAVVRRLAAPGADTSGLPRDDPRCKNVRLSQSPGREGPGHERQ